MSSAIELTITSPGGETRELRVPGPRARLGRSAECEVALNGWRVAKEHALLQVDERGRLVIEDLGGISGTQVNGERVTRHGPLAFADAIVIGGHRVRARLAEPQQPPFDSLDPQDEPHARAHAGAAASSTALVVEDAAAAQRFAWRKRVHDRLLETIDLRRRDFSRLSDHELRAETQQLVEEIVADLASQLPPGLDSSRLVQEVLDEAVGLGPLEALLADEAVTEIMVNRHDQIFVERAGRLQPYPLAFTSDRAVLGVIERIVSPLGRRIDEASPMVDARLKDGSRVNAVIPPLAIKGPALTIRKFSQRRLSGENLVAFGSVSPAMVEFLDLCVRERKNIVVSGGTGSGKTTFLNVLSNVIPDGERIVTIEDAAELRLHHSHLVSLEARPSNVEGRGAVTIRDLVKNALRMRPDRIVVGECRSGEALDMLQAMNTGHEGSLTTLHANSPRDALARLETLVLMAGMELPLAAIREQIASAVDLVVQQTRFACGSRKVTSIAEVTGMENGRIQLMEIFRFEPRGYGADGRIAGRFTGCDVAPTFVEALRERGVAPDMRLFEREEGGA